MITVGNLNVLPPAMIWLPQLMSTHLRHYAYCCGETRLFLRQVI